MQTSSCGSRGGKLGTPERRTAATAGGTARSELATLVFTPDRLVGREGLAGGAGVRTSIARSARLLSGPRRGIPAAYAETLGQRNAALRRVRLDSVAGGDRRSLDGVSSWESWIVSSWPARSECDPSFLLQRFAEHAGELGLDRGDACVPRRSALRRSRSTPGFTRDVERGLTGLGPHLDDVEIAAAGARSSELRLSGRAAPRGAFVDPGPRPFGAPSDRGAPRRRFSCSTTCCPSQIYCQFIQYRIGISLHGNSISDAADG